MTALLPRRKLTEEPARPDGDGDRLKPSQVDVRASERLREAVIAARMLLASTVDAVDPDTSAKKLLEFVRTYRACLAELVAVIHIPEADGDA